MENVLKTHLVKLDIFYNPHLENVPHVYKVALVAQTSHTFAQNVTMKV